MDTSGWTEQEYVAHLNTERRLFAWTLEKYGNYSADEALREGVEFYTYKPDSDESRELIFHDEAWHWAMLTIHGGEYWVRFPDLWPPPDDYRNA